jgi:uncharacterized membrane protein YkoI
MNIRLIASAVIAALLFTGTGTALSAAAQPRQATPADPQPTAVAIQELTAEEATAIALEHAGLTAEEVTGLKVKKDREKGIRVWDVEFRQGDWEFDYDVDIETGAVVKWDKEFDPPKAPKPDPKPPVTEPPVTEPPVSEEPPAETLPPAETDKLLTREEATAIALEHAGLTPEQVLCLKAHKDREKGIPVWEVEFHFEEMEYDYEIHAGTGEVLKAEKERDDDPCDAHKNGQKHENAQGNGHHKEEKPQSEQAKLLSAQEAKTIALAHAGLTAEQVKGIRAEKDREKGLTVWEVEFKFEGCEYEYEINAETGEILHSEKEWDD